MKWTKEEKNFNVGLVTASVAVGAAFGALLGGSMASKFGRRFTMILTDVMTIFAVIPTLFNSLSSILIGRVILGLAIGINSSVVPLYIKEISPLALSGLSGSFHQLLITIGILVSYVFGFGLPKSIDAGYGTSDWWKIMFAIPMIPAIIRLLSLLLIFR